MASSSNLNFNDPMFIHPSDTPGMSLIQDQLVGTDNYGIWSRALLIAMRAKNKIAFLVASDDLRLVTIHSHSGSELMPWCFHGS